MKTLQTLTISLLWIFFLLTLGFLGCHKSMNLMHYPSMMSNSIPQILNEAYLGDMRLPNQTTTEIRNQGSTVIFHFPAGVYLVGKDTVNGQLKMLTEADYTCTGACKQGCDVFYINKHFGCSQCEPSTISCTGHSNTLSGLQGYGFVDLKQGVHFLIHKDQVNQLFSPPDNLFDIPEVRKGMEIFNIQNYGVAHPDFSNPDEYQEVAVNLFGCLVGYLIPKTGELRQQVSINQLVRVSSFSCHCDQGDSGCTPVSGLGFKMCKKSSCLSCTMHVE